MQISTYAVPHIKRSDIWPLYKDALAKPDGELYCAGCRIADHNYLKCNSVLATTDEKITRWILLAAICRRRNQREDAFWHLFRARLSAYAQEKVATMYPLK